MFKQITAETHDAADREMGQLLTEAYEDVKAMLMRNRVALDATIAALPSSPVSWCRAPAR